MTKLAHNLAAKVIAIFLFVFSVIGFISGTVGAYFLAEYDFYETSGEKAKKAVFEYVTRGYANQVFFDYFPAQRNNSYDLGRQQEIFSPENTNFLFILKNEAGDIILSSYSGQKYQFSRTYQYDSGTYTYDKAKGRSIYVEGEAYTMDCFVNETLSTEDRYSTAEYWINFAYSMRYAIIAIAVISLIAAILLFIFLMCGAGHKKARIE